MSGMYVKLVPVLCYLRVAFQRRCQSLRLYTAKRQYSVMVKTGKDAGKSGQKEVTVQFEVLSRHVLKGTGENSEMKS
jgi:hypothetical protein